MSRKVPNYWGWQWRGGVGSSGNRRVPQRPNAMLRSSLEVLEARWLLTIGAPTNYNIGSTTDGFIPNAAPVNVVSADFNQDGKIDLVVAHNSDNSVYFLRGNGDGSFQPAVKTSVGQAIIGQERMGDFNNDGKLDVFLPSAASNSPAIVLLGNGDGTFQTPVTSSSFNGPSGSYPRGWALGDFNGDGKLDVVATLPSNTTGDGGYTVLLGNGNGTFQAGIVSGRVLGYSRWVATADFNGDGKLDLATADGQGTSSSIGNVQLSVMLGNGNGTFQAPTHYASPQLADSADANAVANPEDVVIGDVNGDGKLDCIVSDYDNTINVFLGYGNGTFKAAVSKEVEDYPRDVVIADMNHDGKMDLVVGALGIGQGGSEFPIEGYQPGYVGVLIGNGDGTFHDSIDYHPFAYPGWTAVADFNGDSYPDLATTQVFDGHSLAVMLNNPTSPNLPPTVVSGPTASPSVVTGTSVVLSVLGADDGGESKLTYTWDTTVSPPGAVTFNVNGTNAAKNVTVQFSKPGVYYFRVTVKDATGLSTIGMVPVTVYSTLASIAVTPTAVTVAPSGTQQFTATAKDQFGVALSPQPALSWTVNGGGTISSSGLFTASSTASGQFIVSAKSGSISGTANVTVGTSTSSTATWTGLGTSSNWSDAANWSTNKAPVAGTTVIFNATSTKNAILDTGFAGAVASVQINTGYTGTVTLTKSLIVSGSFTEVAGTFSAGSSTLYLGGNITISGGVFNAGTGTVVISGTTANQNLSAAGVNFYNVVDANSSSYSLNVTGTLTVNGTFTWLRTAGYIMGPNGTGNATIECRGDIDNQNHGNTGNPYFTLDGTGYQTIKDTSGVLNYTGYSGGDFRGLTINKSGGGVILACDPLIYNGLSLVSGYVSTGPNWWFVADTSGTANIVSTAGSLNLGNVTLAGNIGSAFSTGLHVANLNLNGFGFTAPSVLYVSGDWTNSASAAFVAGTGTVIFNGTAANQNIVAGTVGFYNLTDANASGFSLNVTGTMIVNGTFTWLRTAGYIMGPNGTGNAAIECRGDIDNQNHGNTGNPYFTLDGTGYQTIKDTSGVLNVTGYSGGDFRGLTINKSGGGVILACDPLIYNGLKLQSGYVSTGTNWWFVGNTSGGTNIVSTAGSLSLGNVTLAGNIGAAFATGLHVANLNLNAFSFTAPSVLYVSGDWNNTAKAAFNANGGTVIFNGTGTQQKLTSGGKSFYNLTIAVGATVQLQDDLTYLVTLVTSGVLNRNGHKVNGV